MFINTNWGKSASQQRRATEGVDNKGKNRKEEGWNKLSGSLWTVGRREKTGGSSRRQQRVDVTPHLRNWAEDGTSEMDGSCEALTCERELEEQRRDLRLE